jgi:hypothetical protein
LEAKLATSTMQQLIARVLCSTLCDKSGNGPNYVHIVAHYGNASCDNCPGFEMDRNAPERRSGSSFGDRNAVPVHFFCGVPVFFSATGTPFLLNVINLVPTNRSGLPKQYFGNTRLTLHALSS